jgi:hypothetical protein
MANDRSSILQMKLRLSHVIVYINDATSTAYIVSIEVISAEVEIIRTLISYFKIFLHFRGLTKKNYKSSNQSEPHI